MAYELNRGKIVLDQKIGKEKTQVMLDGDIIVPDIKPDMAVILQTDAAVNIDTVEVSNGRVNFTGKLAINVLYLARGSAKPVTCINVSHTIDDFINMDGITKETWVDISAGVGNIDYKMLNDRKIGFRAIVDVEVCATVTDSHEVVTSVTDIPENQMLKYNLKLNRSVDTKSDRFVVKDEMTVPAGKPNIREILQTSAAILNKDVRVQNGKVSVTGEIIVTTLYKGGDDSLIEFVESEIPFNGQIETPGARDDMFADIKLHVKDIYIQVRPDSDGEDRVLEAEISIGCTVKVSSSETIDILEDAYCTGKQLLFAKTPVRYSRLICRNKNQSPIKEIVQIGSSCPDMLQIFRVKGKPVVDELRVIEDKVIAEGILECDILYVAESDDTPLYSYRGVIPFKQIIETKGAAAGSDVSLETSIDHIGFNMLSGREVELRFLLSFNTSVLEEKEMNMVTDIDFLDIPKETLDQMASMTVYVVQPGDSLWKIAKHYNTSLDELISLNDIENPNRIYPGQKLIVLKKPAE